MPDINRVIIAGNLTRDPSFRQTNQQTPVVNFCVASNRKYKDQNGQWREEVCYVGVVAWHKLAESCGKNLTRGSAVLVDGELQSRLWKSEDGDARTVVEIKAHRVQFLDKHNRTETHTNEDESSIDASSSETWTPSEN
ncbi:single-stranded DNA-binding protein [bacterium]|nr:single-stranded DNA-binding protein [bacterium]